MNILISLGPGSWIVWLENDGEKNITNNNGVSFYSQKLSPSWLSFYQTVQDLKAQYPGAKVFTAHSGYGNGIIVSGFFRIVLCNPTNRNEGAKLMRQENGVWVEIVTDSNDVFDLLAQLDLIYHNGTPEMQLKVSQHHVEFIPRFQITV